MKRFCLPLCLVLGTGAVASAQAPPAEAASAPLLEKRVPDELATEGVVLSRQNLGLHVEQIGNKWLVSLVDLTTGRVASSTAIDTLPADREAAVAAMTHVVSELAEQVTGRPATAPVADRAQQVAEQRYLREAIRFDDTYELSSGKDSSSLSREWTPYRGEVHQRLERVDFYRVLGRPDLVKTYEDNRIGRNVAGGLSLAFLGASAIVMGVEIASSDTYRAPDFAPPVVLFGLSFVSGCIAGYYWKHMHVSETEAKNLADAYNQNLRRQLGLPIASQQPRLRDVKIAPYVGEHDGGLVLAAKF